MPRVHSPWRALALAAALAVGGLIAANLFDQELRPEVQAFFARPPAVFSRDSGWALMIGFNAPPGQEPRSHAEAVRKSAGARRAGLRRAEVETEIRAAAELLCIPEQHDCIRTFAARPESIADLAADNAVLLARYDELLRSTQLGDATEALEYYTDIYYFNAVMRTQVVRLSQIGAAAAAGKVDEALAWLEADAAFSRRWLDEAGSILTKMLAVRALSRDLLLAGQIARAGALSPAQWEALSRVVAPLTPSQRGVAPVVRTEAAFFAAVLDKIMAEPRATSEIIEAPRLMASVLSATLKRNATLNFAHPLFAGWTALDDMPTAALAPAIERIRTSTREAGRPDWTWAYNYSGKAFTADSPPDLGEYVYRVRDTDALAALVRCVVALRRPGIPATAAAEAVSRDPACRDPYGGSFQWNAETLELSFRPRSPGQVKRFGGRGDRVAFAAYAP